MIVVYDKATGAVKTEMVGDRPPRNMPSGLGHIIIHNGQRGFSRGRKVDTGKIADGATVGAGAESVMPKLYTLKAEPAKVKYKLGETVTFGFRLVDDNDNIVGSAMSFEVEIWFGGSLEATRSYQLSAGAAAGKTFKIPAAYPDHATPDGNKKVPVNLQLVVKPAEDGVRVKNGAIGVRET